MDCCRKNIFSRVKKAVKKKSTADTKTKKCKKLVLVGTPNVGKSVIFNNLTGAYVTVSNYPGTTVEICRGFSNIEEVRYEVIDTPGMYSLLPITEEERVTRKLLLQEKPHVLAHVIDAKNIERMLSLTLQLIKARLPVILVINMIDEAEKLGMNIDKERLSKALNIPVVTTAAALNIGMEDLKKEVALYGKRHRAA